VTDARDAVLAAVRAALADRPPAPDDQPARAVRLVPDPVEVFAERAAEYRAEVRRVARDGISRAVAEVCAREGAAALARPDDLPVDWGPPHGVELRSGLNDTELASIDGVLTGCALAIAETGTVVLDGGAAQGRRALTLLPDLHILVVLAEQVVGGVPEAISLLGEAVRTRRAQVTFISGPSATSDIEFSRVEGVHGPRRLVILLAG
jgi:L-lactate dehydrogenase complex protein LldG